MNDWMLEQIKKQADNQYMSVNEKVKSILHDFFTKHDSEYKGQLTTEYILSKDINRISSLNITEYSVKLENYSLDIKIEYVKNFGSFTFEVNISYKEYKNEKRKQYTIVSKTDFKQD